MMKMRTKWIVYGMVLMLIAMAPISATAGGTPNGQPFLEIWEELEDLQEQIDNQTADIDDLQAQLDAEIAARIAGDDALQAEIDAEEIARIAADIALQAAINAEEAARIAADLALQANIDAEAAARIAADAALQAAINAEEAARIAGDAAMQAAIDAEEAARIAADNTLQANIDAEAAARIAADAALQAAINAEEAARIAADAALQAAIDAEGAARIAADLALQNNINAEEAARIAGDNTLQANINALAAIDALDYDSLADLETAMANGVNLAKTSGNVGIGTATPTTKLDVNGVITATGGNSNQWNTAYGWGDHSAVDYLTSYTEDDPQVGANTLNHVPIWDGSALVKGTIIDDGDIHIGSVGKPGDVCSGGIVTWSSARFSSRNGYRAFDNNLGTYWESWAYWAYPDWVKYNFGAGNEKRIVQYRISASSSYKMPQTWYFQGSNDDSTWINLDYRTGQSWATSGAWNTYTFSNENSYRYYRLYITQTTSVSGVTIYEIEMNEHQYAITLKADGDGYFAGNVGIGTTSPGAKLDVAGNIHASGIHASGTITSGSSITIDGTNDKITATSGTINFDNENLVTTGNVGIGTGGLSHKLTIRSTNEYTLRLIGPGSYYGHGARINFGDSNHVFIQEDTNNHLLIHSRYGTKFTGGNVDIDHLDVHDLEVEDKIDLYVWANAGNIYTKGPNGQRNCGLSSLSSNRNHGFIAVYDSYGWNRAGMYVDSAGKGVVYGNTKSFRVDNPNDPNTDIWYASVEGPEAAAYIRGTAQLVDGQAVINFPDHFLAVAVEEGMTVQVTPLSADSNGLAVTSKSLDGVVVQELGGGKGNYEFDWEVKCVRQGHEDYQVIRSKMDGSPGPDDIMPGDPLLKNPASGADTSGTEKWTEP